MCFLFPFLFVRIHDEGLPYIYFSFLLLTQQHNSGNGMLCAPGGKKGGRRLERYDNVAAAIMEKKLHSDMH